MARKSKSAGSNYPVPQDDSQARSAIKDMGDLDRDVQRLSAEMNDKISELQEQYGEKVEPLKARIEAIQGGLQTYCEANRDRLTKGGKVKYHRFSTGEISWRLKPAKVSIRGKDAVIQAIKDMRLGKRFLRIKEDVNKEAMLVDKDSKALASGIKGVVIGSDGEDFIVEPFETELQEAS